MMKVSEWIGKASKLHQNCVQQQNANNGSGRMSEKEATTLRDLKQGIGSNHGVKIVTYKQARESLDEMFDMVKTGQKTPPLIKG